jgi:hypothetical protein
MYEDIEDFGGTRRLSVEDNGTRRLSLEDNGAWRDNLLVVSFSSFLSHRNHHTAKWGRGDTKSETDVMLNLKSYVFQWRQWEKIFSTVGWVSFACSPSKVAACAWNPTIGTRVGWPLTQGHFGHIMSGCPLAINIRPLHHKLVVAQSHCTASFVLQQPPPKLLWEISCEKKPKHLEPKVIEHHWRHSVLSEP